MRLIKGMLCTALLACSMLVASCGAIAPPAIGTASTVVDKVVLESTRGLVLANRAYITTHALIFGAIAAGVIKDDASLARIAELDKQINFRLDQATKARDDVTRSTAVQIAFDLIGQLDLFTKPKKEAHNGNTGNNGIGGEGYRGLLEDPKSGKQLARGSGGRPVGIFGSQARPIDGIAS